MTRALLLSASEHALVVVAVGAVVVVVYTCLEYATRGGGRV